MNSETVKTIVLCVLIAISLYLSFKLWSYQPSYSEVIPEEIIPEVDIDGIEKTKQQLIQPRKIIFHDDGKFYALKDPKEQEKLYNEMISWEISDFAFGPKEEETEGKKLLEVIFPNPLNMQLVTNFFDFQNQDLDFPTWSFQRMQILQNEEDNLLTVEFPSIDGRNVAVGTFQNLNYMKLVENYFSREDFNEYILYPDEDLQIYLPKDQVSLPRITTRYTTIRPDKLIQVLFSDPSVVNQSSSSNLGQLFFTDNSQLRVYQDGSKMEYVSPVAEEMTWMTANDLLNFSLDHVNDHKGWTDDYSLLDIKESQNRIIYQLNYNGYPVFSSRDLTTLEQKWNNQRLIEYHRPLFRLSDPLDETTVDLPASLEVINYVQNLPNDFAEDILDIQIGYRLSYESDERIIVLSPSWFANVGGNMVEVNQNEADYLKGGD